MSFKLSLVLVVYPPSTVDNPSLDVSLLQKANAWLQRRNMGFDDDLLVVGIGFEDESALAAMVKPYGLGDAKLAVEPLNRDDDAYELGESMSRLVSRFRHREAISIVNWQELVEGDVYPMDGWWWVGLESVDDEQANSLEVIIRNLVPDAFRDTAITWTAILAACMGLNACGEDYEVYEARMSALTLARWLSGFDAASENSFYTFSASDAIGEAEVDALRLGFEAGHRHGEQLGEYVFGDQPADYDMRSGLLSTCLSGRNRQVSGVLSSAFGGVASLFWSLYTSIWPEFTSPSSVAFDNLINSRGSAELDRPWQFVTDGWIDFTEE